MNQSTVIHGPQDPLGTPGGLGGGAPQLRLGGPGGVAPRNYFIFIGGSGGLAPRLFFHHISVIFPLFKDIFPYILSWYLAILPWYLAIWPWYLAILLWYNNPILEKIWLKNMTPKHDSKIWLQKTDSKMWLENGRILHNLASGQSKSSHIEHGIIISVDCEDLNLQNRSFKWKYRL